MAEEVCIIFLTALKTSVLVSVHDICIKRHSISRHLKLTSPRQSKILEAALKEQQLDSSDEDVVPGATRGSADEDSEEDDEDFAASESSDPEEEYNSNPEDSGDEGSDVEMKDADGDDDDGAKSPEGPPKKKAKVAK